MFFYLRGVISPFSAPITHLFYDGIGQGNRLKWIPFEYEWGARYQPQILWYKNSERLEQEQEQEQEAKGGKKTRKKKSGTKRALEEYYSTKQDDGTDTRKQDKGKEATANKGKESAEKRKKTSTSRWESVSSKYHQEANSQIVNIVVR
jgi:hypothetical protein